MNVCAVDLPASPWRRGTAAGEDQSYYDAALYPLVEDALSLLDHTLGHTGNTCRERAPKRAKGHCERERERGREIPGRTPRRRFEARPRPTDSSASFRLRRVILANVTTLARRATGSDCRDGPPAVINAERRARPSPFASAATYTRHPLPPPLSLARLALRPTSRNRRAPRASPSAAEFARSDGRAQTNSSTSNFSSDKWKEASIETKYLIDPLDKGEFRTRVDTIECNCRMECHPCQFEIRNRYFFRAVRTISTVTADRMKFGL